MYDPIELTEKTRHVVCKGDERKYYRFRKAPFYGGISTADCVGCNLRCLYCWAWNKVNKPDKTGSFYPPETVAEKLTKIAERNGYNQVRISGNEPTIGKEHLLKVVELVPDNLRFILETNGILIGYEKDYAEKLSGFKNLYVRVSLKGTTSNEFSKFTGAEPDAFQLQIKALKNLVEEDVPCHAALIDIAKEDLYELKLRLKSISPELASIEIEPLIEYPQVKKRLGDFVS